MTSLITGGAGFIGAEVTRILAGKGEERTVIFSRNPSLSRLDDVADQVDIIRGDVGNFSHVLNAVEKTKPEVIYHLGAMLSVPSDADPAASIQTNAMGTFYVLEAARLFDVRKVIFASSGAVYGLDIEGDSITDNTIQRPQLFYGATKVFGEHMGLFYKRKYGLDFRGLRYPSIVGPGVRNPGVAQYTSWVIEESAKGNPFTVWVRPDTRIPIAYIKDTALATVKLAEASEESIKTVNYNLDGVKPSPTAGELAEAVKARIPTAQIDFKPDTGIQSALDDLRPIDDSKART